MQLKNGFKLNYGAKKIIKIQNYLGRKKKKKQVRKLLRKLPKNGSKMSTKIK
jgi:hypothetical protein